MPSLLHHIPFYFNQANFFWKYLLNGSSALIDFNDLATIDIVTTKNLLSLILLNSEELTLLGIFINTYFHDIN